MISHSTGHLICKQRDICDMIKGNELDIAEL